MLIGSNQARATEAETPFRPSKDVFRSPGRCLAAGEDATTNYSRTPIDSDRTDSHKIGASVRSKRITLLFGGNLMHLSHEQRRLYLEDGFVVLPALFTADEIERVCHALDSDANNDGPYRIHADGNGSVDTVYAPHHRESEFEAILSSPKILEPVREILASEVYPYQVKVNIKTPFGDNKVEWHQDFAAWHIVDELPEPELVNAAIFLDESTEFNGPLTFIPGTHNQGLISKQKENASGNGHFDPKDIALTPDDLADFVASRGMASVHGPVGTLVLFHPLVAHSSPPNMAPTARRLFLATYNSVSNEPRTESPRAEYLVGRAEATAETGPAPRPSATRVVR